MHKLSAWLKEKILLLQVLFDTKKSELAARVEISRSMNARKGQGVVDTIVDIVVAGAGGAIAAGVGTAIIGDSTSGILATGTSGDLNLTGLIRTVITFVPLIIALGLTLGIFNVLKGARGT